MTIPLSQKVKRIVVVESSGAAVASLSKNLLGCRVGNVEVMNRNWLEMGESEIGTVSISLSALISSGR